MKNVTASDIAGYIKACSLSELKENSGKRLMLRNGEWIADIAVFKFKDNIYAVSNICPHQRSALMYDGYIQENYVVCPVHGWQFDIDTGRSPSGCGKLEVYEAVVFENDVYVKLNEKRITW